MPVERIWIPFVTTVLDAGGDRRYCTANIGTLLRISAITGGTGAAAGSRRGGQVRGRDGGADVAFLHSISTRFSTSNPQINERQFSAGGQHITW